MEEYNKRTLFESGGEVAKFGTTLWKMQPNPPKIYSGNYRIHHYGIGILLNIIGFGMLGSGNKNDAEIGEFLIGFGTELVADDADDLISDLRNILNGF